MPLDFTKPFTTHCSVTIRTQVVETIDKIVITEKANQPKLASKITRSSVMSLLLSKQLDEMVSQGNLESLSDEK